MAKKKEYTDKYELLVEPTTIITRHPDRQRIDLKKMTMGQADNLYSQPGQRYLKKKSEGKTENQGEKPSESSE